MGQTSSPASPAPELDPRQALETLERRSREARGARREPGELARSTEAGADVLHYLAANGAAATRAAVAANPMAAAVTNRLLAGDADEDVRAELARKIARLMPGLSARESGHIFALTVETLECLARDAAVKVRAVLAEAIKTLDCVPRDVVLALARDAAAAVAAPILEYSPLLSDADLIEIIAYGQVKEVLGAIARRRPLGPDVADRLVQSLDVPAVAALLVNPDASLRKETLDRIVAEAEEISAWHMPLALRADLSARAVRRIAALAGAAIIEKLAARNDLSDATRQHLNRELRARLGAEGGDAAGDVTPAEAVAAARAQGLLDGAFVERAAQAGQREQVVLALAMLAHVTDRTVRRILAASNPKPLVALVWHAHLSMRVAFKIQTFVMKLPGHDVLPARGGVGFPLTKEEMRWHLLYFNLPV
jgi:uncharacterized protein (DUF2336 family)